ncbi:glycosyltransferase family 39 protein [Patescibacteria group bacterium]|nr:glycosyltransferase family 39 protein [Patescibacteria group bacterium]
MNKKILILVLVFLIEIEAIVYSFLLEEPRVTFWKENLPSLDVPVMASLLAFILVLSLKLVLGPHIKIKLPKVSLPALTLTIILAVGIYLRLQAPLRHYQFNDEEIYLHRAQMINNKGFPTDCTFGIFVDGELNCSQHDGNFGGISIESGYSVLLAGVFKLAGTSETAAYAFNIFLGVASIVLAYFAGRQLSKGAGLISATIISVLPEHIWWSATTSLDVPLLFFLLASVLSFLVFLRKRKYYLFILALSLATYAAFIRPEAIILIPIFAAPIVLQKKLRRVAWGSTANLILTILLSFFVVVNLLTTISDRFSYFPNIAPQGYAGFFSFAYFKENLADIIPYHIETAHFYLGFILVGAALGTYRLIRKSNKSLLVTLALPAVLFFVYTSYSYGGYSPELPSSIRFGLIWWSLLTIPAGFGYASVFSTKVKYLAPVFSIFLLATFALYLQSRYLTFIPYNLVPEVIGQRQGRLDFQRANPSCLYVDNLPLRGLFHGFNAASYGGFIAQMAKDRSIIDHKGCVVFFETQQCNEERRKTCEMILSSGRWEKLSYDNIPTWQLVMDSQDKSELRIPSTKQVPKPPSLLELIRERLTETQ